MGGMTAPTKNDWEWSHLCLCEQSLGAKNCILNTHSVGVLEGLARPLIERIGFLPRQVITLSVHDPSDDGVVDGNAHECAEDLEEENFTRRNVHIMVNLLILQHVLCPIPSVPSNAAVDRGTTRMLMAFTGFGVHHVAVHQLVERPCLELIDSWKSHTAEQRG